MAFGMGLFSGKGTIGPGKHRAFAVTSEIHASDMKLRFYDCCGKYKVIFSPYLHELKYLINCHINIFLGEKDV